MKGSFIITDLTQALNTLNSLQTLWQSEHQTTSADDRLKPQIIGGILSQYNVILRYL